MKHVFEHTNQGRLIHVRMIKNIQKEELVSRNLVIIRTSGLHYYKGKFNFLMQNTSMASFDGGSADKVDDVTA